MHQVSDWGKREGSRASVCGLRALLPPLRIPAGVETGNDGDLLTVHREVKGVGEPVEHQRTPDAVAPHDRVRQRLLGNAEDRAVQGPSKAAAKGRGAFGVPVLGFDDVVTSSGGEDDRQGHRRASSSRSASQLVP